MTNPYIIPRDWIDTYRANCEEYDYRNRPQWPTDCPIWTVLAPGDDLPHRRWADHQVAEISNNPYELPAYVCHPYELDTEAMQDLLALERAGFTVHISGHSEYHPSSLRVEIHPNIKHFQGVDHFDAEGRPVPMDEHTQASAHRSALEDVLVELE